MGEVKLYTRNFIDDESTVASTHGSAFLEYLYDRDKDSQYVTSGANDDETEVTLTAIFNFGGEEVERTIDRILLINHNLKDIAAEYWDGDSWEELDTLADVDDETTVITFSEVSTSRVRIRCTTTQTADAEKRVGEFVACGLEVELESGLVAISGFQASSRQMSNDLKLADGSINRTYVKHTVNRTEKFELRLTADYVTIAQLETLRDLRERGEEFLIHPESSARPDELYLVHWFGPFAWKYMSTSKAAGVQVVLDLREV